MKRRTKAFAVRIITFAENLPRGRTIDRLARQLVDCSTSVGANYRAACLARSRAEFTSKLQISLEEADESQYWLEVLSEAGFSGGPLHEDLHKEAKELTSILMSGVKTVRGVT
ncbi:MAG TPA: four helix bundle protein [Candidatus Hodarchaeales archaeon]|nr:four helix bundle protein [Candidatus Hodarchaeales archaeon]